MFDSGAFSTDSFSINAFDFGEIAQTAVGRPDPFADFEIDLIDVVKVVILSGVLD